MLRWFQDSCSGAALKQTYHVRFPPEADDIVQAGRACGRSLEYWEISELACFERFQGFRSLLHTDKRGKTLPRIFPDPPSQYLLLTDPLNTQGALLKGVKLFNDEMLSRWRTEGFLDFASSSTSRATPTSLGSVHRCALRQGRATEMLRDMLAVDKGVVEVAIEPAKAGLPRHQGVEHGDGAEGVGAAASNSGARETSVAVSICSSH